ncbi:uncharacterized protein TRAVEDRAFT_105233, partial [Trametes versicolor FP-101664 SS1]|uniref:uncharacterized protein n=1 Tax=Trametes versicolor (strain FP-101664) TaxID=717944 RepID=UPI0004621F71
IKAFIKDLLGFDRQSDNLDGGILGVVKAFYSCVEAQGRGTLHCHMMVWVEGGLDPKELQQKLSADGGADFGKRLIAFLEDTISNDIPLGTELGDGATEDPAPRQLDAARIDDLRRLVLKNQMHRHTDTCYKYCGDGPRKCRFDLEEDNVVMESVFDEETGDLILRILNGMVNNYNPTMLEALRCNMDLQYIGSGEEAKAVIYYITDYITKSPLKAHVAYAALELAVKKLTDAGFDVQDSFERARRLLQRTAFSIISNQELSAPQVASYLMDYEDHFTSHRFANLYWPSFERYIDKTHGLSGSQNLETDGNVLESDNAAPTEQDEGLGDEEVAISTTPNGEVVQLSSQLTDYLCRGDGLRSTSLWDFIATTRKTSNSV